MIEETPRVDQSFVVIPNYIVTAYAIFLQLAKVKVNVSRSADEVTASGRQREKGQMALFKASRIPKHRQVRLIAKPAGLSDETDLHDPIPAMHGV